MRRPPRSSRAAIASAAAAIRGTAAASDGAVRLALGGDEQRDDLADRPRVEVVQVWPGRPRWRARRARIRRELRGRLHADHVRLVDRPQPQRAVERVAGGRDEVELRAQRVDPSKTAANPPTVATGPSPTARAVAASASAAALTIASAAASPSAARTSGAKDANAAALVSCAGQVCGAPKAALAASSSVVDAAAAVVGAQCRAQPGGADPRAAALVAQPRAPAVGGPQRAVCADRERHDAGAHDQHDARLSVQRARVRGHGVAGHRGAFRPQRSHQRIAERARRFRRRERPGCAHDHLVDRAEPARDDQDRRLRGPHAARRREPRRARTLGPPAG